MNIDKIFKEWDQEEYEKNLSNLEVGDELVCIKEFDERWDMASGLEIGKTYIVNELNVYKKCTVYRIQIKSRLVQFVNDENIANRYIGDFFKLKE